MADKSETSETPHSEIVIVGGGPVGLALAYLLGRQGIRVVLFEKNDAAINQPKGQNVDAASVELYAQWGVLPHALPRAWPFENANGQGLYHTLREGVLSDARKFYGSEADFRAHMERYTPQIGSLMPSAAYESGLRIQATTWPSVSLRFKHQVDTLFQDTNGAEVSGVDLATGERFTEKTRYVVAADGPRSLLRGLLGIGEELGPDFSAQIVTTFAADLDQFVGNDHYFHFFIARRGYEGWFGQKQPDTGLWRYNFANPEGRDYTQDEIIERIRGAVGVPDLPIEIKASNRYSYTTALTRQWRSGRVFFVGDAAHRHSVWGGFGHNLGLQDANNLAWKLALVVKGRADESILETYEAERRPEAAYTLKVTSFSTYALDQVRFIETITDADGRKLLSLDEESWIKEAFRSLRPSMIAPIGQYLGVVYRSDAVIDPGFRRSTVGNYVPQLVPGARAPHAWLRRSRSSDGGRLSVVELWRGSFALLADATISNADDWRVLAGQASAQHGFDIDVHLIGPGAGLEPLDDGWFDHYGALGARAVLVRPDGFIAALVSTNGSTGPTLHSAFARILGPRSTQKRPAKACATPAREGATNEV